METDTRICAFTDEPIDGLWCAACQPLTAEGLTDQPCWTDAELETEYRERTQTPAVALAVNCLQRPKSATPCGHQDCLEWQRRVIEQDRETSALINTPLPAGMGAGSITAACAAMDAERRRFESSLGNDCRV